MLIECNVLCYDRKEEELTGDGKDSWLPFMFLMEDVRAIKLTNDDKEDKFGYGKTSLFLHPANERHIIDIDYNVFKEMFKKYHAEINKHMFSNYTN